MLVKCCYKRVGCVLRNPGSRLLQFSRRLDSSLAGSDGFSEPETITIVPTVDELVKGRTFEMETKTSLVGHLRSRYLVEGVSDEELVAKTGPGGPKLKVYCGADPTAKSLHIGNLLPMMVLLHFALRGHSVVGLVGGATGAVGDPSGRDTERTPMEEMERLENVDKIQGQIRRFLTRGVDYARSRGYPLVAAKSEAEVGRIETENNANWWSSIKMLEFLSQYGRHIRVSAMLGRDSIQSRLRSQQGIGFNEFTYQILQAFDFWHLYREKGVNVQVGGNDQWGNIVAGIDLISRLQKVYSSKEKGGENKSVYGLTVPLLTTPTGEKFGKSAGNAVFVSEDFTSPYQLYQYFINTPDEIVGKLLKVFTLLPVESIDEVVSKHEQDPGLRIAQRVLAREVTDLIHGIGVGDEMAYITSFLFPTPDQPFDDELSADKLIKNFQRSGILVHFKFDDFHIDDLKMSSLLSVIIEKSKTETKKLIKAGGIYLGLEREKLEDPDDVVLFDKDNHLIDGKLLLVRVGKQKYYVVEFS